MYLRLVIEYTLATYVYSGQLNYIISVCMCIMADFYRVGQILTLHFSSIFCEGQNYVTYFVL